MKHINLLLVLLAINTNIILGSIVPVEKAQRVARNAYYERIGQFDKSINSEITFEKPIIVKAKALPVYYVFNSLSDNSFIVVSADDIATPVLAFSSESKLNPDNCIPPVKNLLAFYEEQILFARENNYEADKEVIKEWQYYASQNFTAKKASKADYLLNSLWDQDIYFNNACPLSNEGKTPSYLGGRVYAGCDATAMAQIIRYHTYPKSGKGTKTYSSPTSICPGFPKYGPLTVNFAAQTYNYSSMPYSNITASNCSEIAKLLYHCGVAMEMCYSIQGSGAYIYSVASAYTDYFDYTSSPNKPTVYSKDNSDASVWEGAMKAEIDAKRPVHYAGNSSSGNDGHAFVLDGYSGSTFHFNFGWKGSQNGFYALSAIKVTASSTSHNYSYHQFAILPIIPKSTGPV
ncbi:MAG: C10 family peptidase, partial [Bacteroidales bacterium]|nr:C10 family peptidase [Bacteroidales bacterium]